MGLISHPLEAYVFLLTRMLVCFAQNHCLSFKAVSNPEEMTMSLPYKASVAVVILMAMFFLSACAPTMQAVDRSDVVTDVSGLELDRSTAPVLTFKRPDAPYFDAYDRFIVDYVQVNYSDPKMKDISPEQVGEMQEYFRNAVIKELRQAGFEVGTRTEPNTMRISFTISNLKAPSAAANVTAAVVPFALSVGEVTIEAVFREAVSDRIDAVVVEHSRGSRALNPSPWSTWSDVTDSFDRWAKGIRESVEQAHGR